MWGTARADRGGVTPAKQAATICRNRGTGGLRQARDSCRALKTGSAPVATQLLAGTYTPFDLKNLSAGDTAWVLASAALVLLMTPGLAFFYGGMVRAKHVLAMLMQNFAAIAIVSVTWVVIGFSWAFGGNGRSSATCTIVLTAPHHRRGADPRRSARPPRPWCSSPFQLTFAIITPALITGSTADRWKFGAFVAFVAAWSILIYAPVAHWVFDGYGWLNRSLRPAGHTSSPRTSPAARSCTSTPVPPAWRWRSCSAGGGAGRGSTCAATTSRSCCSAPACSGSAGSGSTPARRSRAEQPGRLRLDEHQHRDRDRAARLDASWRSCATASRPRSARRPVRSPAWSRSRRVPASSARSARCSSASSPASAARSRSA